MMSLENAMKLKGALENSVREKNKHLIQTQTNTTLSKVKTNLSKCYIQQAFRLTTAITTHKNVISRQCSY